MAQKDPFREKAEVYTILSNILFKFILLVAGLAAFFWILYKMFEEPDIYSKGMYAFLGALLAGTVYKMYSHHFPSSSQ